MIFIGLATRAIGLILISFTLGQPVAWYSHARMAAELGENENFRTHENPTTANLGLALPDDGNTG